MAKNKRPKNEAEAEEIEEIAALEETAEKSENAEESQETYEKTETAEQDDEETEVEEESKQDEGETETDGESEQDEEETEADEESEQDGEETEADEDSEQDGEETEADEESEQDEGETETDGESEQDGEETEADEESEQDEEETEADEEYEQDEEETEADEEFEQDGEETEADEESEQDEEETEADEESEQDEEETEADEESEQDEEETEADEDSAETVDDDDYLDYDEDTVRPKKKVSGKAATVTMLLTFFISIIAVVGAFMFASKFQRSMSVALVSYTDRFNSCRTNDFSYGSMLGINSVSFSDTECTLTENDIKDLKSGKTVTKFNGLVNIGADVRFGKLVSMDVTFNPEIDQTENPSGYYTLLAGNVIAGLIPDVSTSDYGFMLAYTILSYSVPVEGQENVYKYQVDDMNFYVDYSKAMKSQSLKDITIHVENAEPHYIDTSNIDVSWLPWNKQAVSDSDASSNVSQSDN